MAHCTCCDQLVPPPLWTSTARARAVWAPYDILSCGMHCVCSAEGRKLSTHCHVRQHG